MLASSILATALLVAAAAPAPTVATADQVLRAVRESKARVVVVNVWATWCVPCREEFPDLLKLRRTYGPRGVTLVLVSADFAAERAQAAAFLSEQGVDFPTYLKTGDDMQFINAFDPAWSGALPATFIYDARGRLRHALLGKSSYAQFEAKILDVLKGA